MAQPDQNTGFSQDQLRIIEAALHTQSKILAVQASAGGSAVRDKLNDVKEVLARVGQLKKPVRLKPCARIGMGWLGMSSTAG
jgi:hypothetical protein